MSERRTPNDLLANILGGGKKPAGDAAAAPTPSPTTETVPSTPVPQNVAPTEVSSLVDKAKATFYLPETATDDLEAIWIDARRMVAKDKRSLLSKSYLVEVAIALLYEEFKTQGSNSRLFNIVNTENP